MDNNLEQNIDSKEKFIISSSPHLYKKETTRNIMWLVVLALLPAAIFGVFSFGFNAFIVIFSSVVSCVLAEMLFLKMRNKKITIDDGSAVLTGLLLGLNMPPNVPLYVTVISSFFAIGLVKHAFGGLGENWANPAIAARVFALVAWGKKMTTWAMPVFSDSTSGASADAVSAATPLGAVKSALSNLVITENAAQNGLGFFQNIFYGLGPMQLYKDHVNPDATYFSLFIGDKAGSIGEISILLLLVGAIYLLYRKIITLDIPLSYILTSAVIAFVFGGLQYNKGFFQGDFLFHILTGGLVLGAFFMATDMVTTPLTTKGRIVFGVGCGVLTMLIRLLGGMPEGVSLSILFMNMMTPTIDRFITVKPMGYIKEKKQINKG